MDKKEEEKKKKKSLKKKKKKKNSEIKKIEGIGARNFFRESPALIEGNYTLTKIEMNIIMALLTTINKKDDNFKDYSFSIQELEVKLGRKINATQLKKYARTLVSKTLEIKTESKKGKKGYTIFSWFSYFSYEEGVITCAFNSRLKPYLLELRQYAKGGFQSLLLMRSNYSKRIYMLLKQYVNIGERTLMIAELKRMLFIGESMPKSYEVYSHFKIKVINQAVEDINKHTDLWVSFKDFREGRSVNRIVFSIGKKIEEKTLIQQPKKTKKTANSDENDSKKVFLKDRRSFIAYIRSNYVNADLLEIKDKNTQKELLISVSPQGKIYSKRDVTNLSSQRSNEIWDGLYDLAKKGKLKILL